MVETGAGYHLVSLVIEEKNSTPRTMFHDSEGSTVAGHHDHLHSRFSVHMKTMTLPSTLVRQTLAVTSHKLTVEDSHEQRNRHKIRNLKKKIHNITMKTTCFKKDLNTNIFVNTFLTEWYGFYLLCSFRNQWCNFILFFWRGWKSISGKRFWKLDKILWPTGS